MNTNYRKVLATLSMALVSVLLLPQAEAQLLKKISKGIEKASKTLEKVDQTLNNSKQQTQGNSTNNSETSNEMAFDESNAVEEIEVAFQTPYLTSETLFLDAAPWTVSNVYDGVFSVKRGENYEFWKVDGQKLFDANWESLTTPEFHCGVVGVRKASSGNTYKRGNICLLYTDGRVKEMDPSWDKVTNFVDGVAIVTTNVSSNNKAFYIDTTGKKIYPNVPVDGYTTDNIRPLRDGLRAFPKAYQEWGYIDANGVVKMAPKFKSATDFSEGHAWVVMPDNTKHLIDKTGKSVFQAPEANSVTSDVVDGRFFVEQGTDVCYYDLQGNLLRCFKYGNCFYDGYAYVTQPRSFGDMNSLLIDKDMNILREIDWNIVGESEVCQHEPVFTKSGLASIKNHLIKPDGKVVLNEFSNDGTIISQFSQVSDCDYLLASNVYINDISAAAILKPTGEVVWLISQTPRLCGPYSANSPLLGTSALNAGGNVTLKSVNIHQTPIGPKTAK